MFQDISPHEYRIAYEPREAAADDILLCYDRDSVLTISGTPLVYPLCGSIRELQYLFSVDGKGCFLYVGAEKLTIPNTEWKRLGGFREAEPRHMAFLGLEGAHLSRWYGQHRFCGSCGKPMHHSETERAMICDSCHITCYPQIAPAIIVGVTDGDNLLLTRYADRPYKNYSLIAGFCEVGETLEDTIHREVMEEVGLQVKNIRYYKSQPWPYSDSLLVGFFCDVDGSRESHADGVELSEAAWHHRDQIDYADNGVSLTGEMIELFKQGKEPK